jgi:DNA ligase (NAD+)
MRIKDIAENTLSKLIESSLLDGNPIDLYKLDYKKVSKLKGFGSKSADVIKNALEERKEVFDYEFFGAWNWSGVGRSMMKKVFAEMNAKSLMKLLSEGPRVFKQRILQIPGFKDKLTGNLFKGLDDDFDEIMEFITKKYVILKESRSKKQVENSLSFVVTGTLNKYPLRDDLKMKIEAEGHSLKSSVSSKTNYVIVGKSPGKEKIAKAKELGIPIIEEKEFLNVSGL